MLKVSDLSSSAFRRLTGGEKPRLNHPTANAFDERPWLNIIDQPGAGARDLELATAALFFWNQIHFLREHFIFDTFTDLSTKEILRLAIGRANRSLMLIRRRLRSTPPTSSSEGDAIHLQAAAHRLLPANALQTQMTADGLISTLIDAIPHWFAEAARASHEGRATGVNFAAVGQRGDAAFSIERSYRDLWQQVLWESWTLGRNGQSITLNPSNREDATLWHAWGCRQEAVTLGPALLDKFAGTLDDIDTGYLLQETVIGIRMQGRSTRIKIGKPDKKEIERHALLAGVVQRSYLKPFLEIPLSKTHTSITPELLLKCWLVLQDLTECFLRAGYIEGLNYSEIDRLTYRISRASIESAFERCLLVSPELSREAVKLLVTDPHNIAACFNVGVWHRPLIALGSDDLMILAAPVIFGNNDRRVERWLKDAGLGDNLSKTPPGIVFERKVRAELVDAVSTNPIQIDGEVYAHEVPAKKGQSEQIDFLARIGGTILVGEIKCFLIPSESSERFNHRRKMEEAADQAERKSTWLESRTDLIKRLLPGSPSPEKLTFLPLVIMNQSTGSGQRIGRCIVTDAHFLKLYFGNGSFHSSAAVNLHTGEFQPVETRLYAHAREAEEHLASTLENPPGLAPFLEAVEWYNLPVPLEDGTSLLVSTPNLGADKLQSHELRTISARFTEENRRRKGMKRG